MADLCDLWMSLFEIVRNKSHLQEMFEPLECVALRTVRYNDRNSILSVYTRQHGRMSLLVPSGNTRASVRLRALTMPLGRFECVADVRPGRDIYSIRDVKPAGGVVSMPFSPMKSAIALFVADFLSSVLRETQQDEALYSFLLQSVDALASAGGASLANFHICFMLRLQHFLGIEPDWHTYMPGAVFDLADGIFRDTPPLHRRFLPTGEAAAAYALRRMNYRTAGVFRMSHTDRNSVVDRLLMYYQVHFPSVGALNSLSVMRAMFSGS